MSTIIFPGQGSQYTLMTKDFYDEFKICRDIFDIISNHTNVDLKKIIFENPSDILNQTKYTQLSIFCSSISIFRVIENEFESKKLDIKTMFGHSLGEYTSLAASNILSLEDCAKLLKIRSELMQDAIEPNKSGMAALIGLTCNQVEELINSNNLQIEIANDNSPMQVVISGLRESLINSEEIFKKAGAKRFILLNVSAAFHSKFMKDAQRKLESVIENTKFNDSNISIISNFDGKISNNKNIIKANLSKQMANRVRWVESINNLEMTNMQKIIEIGPGKVLSGLIKRITNNFNVISIENISDIKKLND